jgi:hypothetical protein
VSPAKYSYPIAGRAGRNWSGLIQERAPLFAMIFGVINLETDANAVLAGRELELR